jgi:hypothetical protein
MKALKYFCFLISILLCFVAHAEHEHNFGAGIMIGAPTGLTVKNILNNKNSIDGALAWSDGITYHIHGDYLWNRPKLFYLDQYPVDWYFGFGARLRDRSHKHYDSDHDGMQLGARVPVGLEFMFHDPRIEVFAELALIFNVTPSSDADFDGAIGARFYF